MILIKGKERIRFLKFAAVGVFGAIIDFGMMNLLTQIANMRLVWAGIISFLCAIISNFIWNRYWTYPDSRSRAVTHQLTMFFVVNITGLVFRVPLLHYLEPYFKNILDSMRISVGLTTELIAKNITLAVAVGIVMVWNFLVNRYWTYNDVE
ncbi:MAG: GtrA family protein [Anaerolineae bacterium]|nr:GtrA family protein [Anaerolineae bacterium]MDK1080466.1 GtrA family protein [Anaerolineae bacterium]MDK1117261.1 GtrA family protein [Anaerolineae bacterium]